MTTETKQEVVDIYADKIIEPVQAMRRDYDEQGLIELAADIKANGLTNPITVRPVGDKFEIVAGHRRYLAMLRIPWSKIPCFVKNLTDAQALAIKTGENYQRAEVNPVDEAHFLKNILRDDLSNIDEVATVIRRSKDYILDRLEILTYPDYFHPPLQDKTLSLGVARALVQITDEHYRKMFFDQAIRDGMKIWTAEYYLAQFKAGIFKKGEEIIPPSDDDRPNTPPVVRHKCAKCGNIAESPNLTNVFIHIECPPDNVPLRGPLPTEP